MREYVGGYDDWLRQRGDAEAAVREREARRGATASRTVQGGKAVAERQAAPAPNPRVAKKLSYKEQRELDELPAQIDTLEGEQQALTARMAGAEFYKEGAEAIAASLARAESLARELTAIYSRWAELEARRRD